MVEDRRVSARTLVRPEHYFQVGAFEDVGRWPEWLAESVAEFQKDVGDPEYPCHFGRAALELGELFGTWSCEDQPITALGAHLGAFLDATRTVPNRRMVLAAFFEPEPEQRDHEWYGERFWSVLAELRAGDDAPWPSDVPTQADHPRWEFSYHGVPMFVFAATPTHHDRRSRSLGPGLIMLFQPRNVFAGIEGGTPSGIAARRRIRDRQLAWDAAPPHPFMGSYGDPSNSEWKQYFIADDEGVLYDRCPLPAADPCLHDLVAAQARLTPDAPAVIVGDRVLDYRSLDRAANALAVQLVSKGVRPDDRVGVLADRSADTVVSLLAVLKAGAAYVPIDPSYPEDRRAYLLEDVAAEIVVTPRRLVGSVPIGPRWLLLSDEPLPPDGPDGPDGPEVSAPFTGVRPDNLAYVIYTSGSTGTPKGVAVAHRQIVFSTQAQHAVDRPWPEAFLMPISFSFDASAVGVFHTLSAGGCVVLPTEDEHRDPARLRALIQRYGVTHTDCTPSLYDLILGTDPTPVRSLRCVQVGGEVCPPDLVARHRDLLPECVFENNYGPTEATIWSTTALFHPDSAVPRGRVPIGRPIPGAAAHVLDGVGDPVAPGDLGELYVGGSGIARGYVGRPGLTAERFLPDPFSTRPGQRLYRTGDVVRELPDGGLDFIGRRDSQVKVRGFRIELGEIEAVLRRHPEVVEVAVDVRVIGGEPTLVGYLRLVPDRDCPDAALVSYLAPHLPDHMVPRRYVRIDRLPRTVSGKVDRSALPSPVAPPRVRVQADRAEGLALR
jgi:amino acid adenylation domain-containing protein